MRDSGRSVKRGDANQRVEPKEERGDVSWRLERSEPIVSREAPESAIVRSSFDSVVPPTLRTNGYSTPFLLAVFAALVVPPVAAQGWKPPCAVELVVGSGSGGAADRQARVVQKHLQAFPGMPGVVINNRPGGAGNVAYAYIAQHPGEGQYLITMSTNLLTNQIVGTSAVGYQDVTPLNILVREYISVWVRNESPIATGKDLVTLLKKDPAAVSFAFS